MTEKKSVPILRTTDLTSPEARSALRRGELVELMREDGSKVATIWTPGPSPEAIDRIRNLFAHPPQPTAEDMVSAQLIDGNPIRALAQSFALIREIRKVSNESAGTAEVSEQ